MRDALPQIHPVEQSSILGDFFFPNFLAHKEIILLGIICSKWFIAKLSFNDPEEVIGQFITDGLFADLLRTAFSC